VYAATVVAGALLIASPVVAATYTWQASQGDWSVASNWGGTLPTSAGLAYIANGGTANVTLSGATCGTLALGDSGGSGNLQMSGGSLAASQVEYIGYTDTGILSQSGGTNNVSGTLYLGYAASGAGTYNLNSGLLLTAAVTSGSGSSTFNFSGGTLRATGSNTALLSGLTAAYIQSGGAIIDTNGFSDTIGQALLHDPSLGATNDGGLTKFGGGVLTLAASSNYTGATLVKSGTLVVSDPLALQNSTLDTTGGNCKVAGALTSVTLAGLKGSGGLNLASSSGTALAISIGSNNATTTFSGIFSGSGSLTKVGTGRLTLSSFGLTGTGTTVSSGTLQLSGGGSSASVTVNGGVLDAYGGGFTFNTVNLINGAIVDSSSSQFTLTAGTVNAQSGRIGVHLNGNNAVVTKTTSGTVTLSASNSYYGGTELYDGVLQIGPSGALGNNVLDLYGGTLCSSGTGALAYSLSNAIEVRGGGTLGDLVNSGSLSFAYGAFLWTNAQLTVNSPVTVSGGVNLGSSYSFTKAGPSILVINGIPYSPGVGGPTTISAGTLQLNTTSTGGTPSAPQLATPSITVNAGGVLALGASDVLGYQNGVDVLTINGGTVSNITAAGRVTLQNTVTMMGGVLTGPGSGAFNGVYSINTTNGFIATSDANGNPAIVNPKTIALQAGDITFNVTRGAMNPASDMIVSASIIGFNIFPPVFAGPFGIAKAGNGVLTLLGSNIYGGATTISGGTLAIGNPLALQNSTLDTSGSGTLSFLDITGATLGGLTGSGAFSLTNTASSAVAISLGNNGKSTTFSGMIIGSGAVIKIGSGMLNLTSANTFSGNTLISGGTLTLGNPLSLQQSTLDTSGSGLLSFGTQTAGTLGGLTGAGTLNLANTSGAVVALSVGNNGANTTFTGMLKGLGNLSKLGSGTLTLSGTNTYTGATTVAAGTLIVANRFAFIDGASLNVGSVFAPEAYVPVDARSGTAEGNNLEQAVVPEPSALALLAAGTMGLAALVRRTHRFPQAEGRR
jgi:autotransporter-associated beta strand protein